MTTNQSESSEVTGIPGLSEASGVPFTIRQQVEFTRKELRETLRDRRTIVTLLIMPILLYPLLGFGLRCIAFQQSGESKLEYRLAIETEREAMWLSEALGIGDQALSESQSGDVQPNLQVLVLRVRATPANRTSFLVMAVRNSQRLALDPHHLGPFLVIR